MVTCRHNEITKHSPAAFTFQYSSSYALIKQIRHVLVLITFFKEYKSSYVSDEKSKYRRVLNFPEYLCMKTSKSFRSLLAYILYCINIRTINSMPYELNNCCSYSSSLSLESTREFICWKIFETISVFFYGKSELNS